MIPDNTGGIIRQEANQTVKKKVVVYHERNEYDGKPASLWS